MLVYLVATAMAELYLGQSLLSSRCAAASIHHYYRHYCHNCSNIGRYEQYVRVAGCWLMGLWHCDLYLYQGLPLG